MAPAFPHAFLFLDHTCVTYFCWYSGVPPALPRLLSSFLYLEPFSHSLLANLLPAFSFLVDRPRFVFFGAFPPPFMVFESRFLSSAPFFIFPGLSAFLPPHLSVLCVLVKTANIHM